MSDYQSAKQVLLKAWKLKTPDEEEHENIESNLRVGEYCTVVTSYYKEAEICIEGSLL